MLFTTIAAIIVLICIYLLVKGYDARLVLFVAGLIMCAVAGDFMKALNAFSERMSYGGLLLPIVSATGYAYVVASTKCDKHLVWLISDALKKFRPILIPGTVIATWLISTSIMSMAGVAAMMGPIMIPVLTRAGISPAMAAASIIAGTWGHVISPASMHNNAIAKMQEVGVMDIITRHITTDLICLTIVTLGVTLVAYLIKEDGRPGSKQFVAVDAEEGERKEKINILMALCPFLPIVILMLGNTGVVPAFKISIPAAMLISAMITIAVTLTKEKPSRAFFEGQAKAFYDGMGMGYGSIMGIIIAAAVFTTGINELGVIKQLTEVMTGMDSLAKVAGGFGTFFLAVITGSGDAATLAFNELVTPHAAQFGVTPYELGSAAFLGGVLGRTMSPLAGLAIIAAGIARVSTMETTKRLAIPCLVAATTMVIML
ncbi:C4-dicarboxylate transporter DcuC [Synergistaceae bacterium OttesenSCG-928-I11]|nr:C4-dicarboxylate transporter DcuC [Synergistaceae bacterium OttesenSCG-928-I11]